MSFPFTSTIILEDDRALIRPLQKTDLEHLLPVASQTKELVQYSPYFIHNRKHLENYIDTSLHERSINFRYPFIIFDKQQKAFAGSSSFANISDKDQRVEIGWTWIGVDFQKTGLNRHCKFLMLQYAFEALQFERVEFKTDARNQISRTAMEKLGAVYEGALRSHTLMSDGLRRTTVYYSILRAEWDEIKQKLLKTRG
jgi:RimJ/RimL family protein N-acetyltransferase